MSATAGSPHVRVKLATTNDEWAKVFISLGMEVADVAALACSSLAWGLTPNRFRLFMVAKAGEPRPPLPAPEAFTDLVPLAGEATLESAGVTSGAWLVAVPTTPVSSGGSGGGSSSSGDFDLVSAFASLDAKISSLVQQVKTKDCVFSAAP